MESIEKLRELAVDINSAEIIDHLDVVGKFMFRSKWLDSWHKAFDAACDEIEAEIEERYMELPVDADGKTIHVGDRIRISVNETATAELVGYYTVAFQHGDGLAWKLADGVRNVEYRTLEDMLRMLIDDYKKTANGPFAIDFAPTIKRYADKIRELLGGDA